MVAAIWSDPDLLMEADLGSTLENSTCPYVFRVAGYGHEMSWCGVPPEIPALEYAYNSGTVMLSLAFWMGFTTIRMVGMEMAYTAGEFHPGEAAPVRYHPRAMAAEDIRGNWTLTTEENFVAATKIETWAWLAKKHGVRVVNASGAGIIRRFVEIE